MLFEFKVLPYLVSEVKNLNKDVYVPVQDVEFFKNKLMNTLREEQIEIISGPLGRPEIFGLEMIIKQKNYPMKIIFSTQQPPQTQLASLQLILKEAKIREKLSRGEPPKLIDLTGDKPYVSF